MEDFALWLIRFTSAILFFLAAWFAKRRYEREPGFTPWVFLTILGVLLGSYRLVVWIVYSVMENTEVQENLAEASTVAANVAFVACGLMATYATVYRRGDG